MVLIVTSKANQKAAEKYARNCTEPVCFASPTHTGVNYHASKVVIVGAYPALERRYRGVMPIETIDPNPGPPKQLIKPEENEPDDG